jgi:hypothetical protein
VDMRPTFRLNNHSVTARRRRVASVGPSIRRGAGAGRLLNDHGRRGPFSGGNLRRPSQMRRVTSMGRMPLVPSRRAGAGTRAANDHGRRRCTPT